MKLAISNIAWQPEEEMEMISLIADQGVEGLEFALPNIGRNRLRQQDRISWN